MLSPTAPAFDQLEVTLIGPGYGECVVLHAEGEWIIVDSCRDPSSRLPVAHEYLTSLAVDPAAVKLISCTHWHDDHIAGLADLYASYPSAAFCLSGALKVNEFTRVLEVFKDWQTRQPIPISSGLDEMTKVITMMRAADKRPTFATANRQIWQSASGNSRLFALSPSDETLIRASEHFASLMPHIWTDQRRAKDSSPNHIAVAMHITCGSHAVLLGSDLEEHGSPHTGWSAVVSDPSRPQAPASLYKVAHHGSETAEHPGIWASLLSAAPVSAMTPFSKSHLPTGAQRDAIRQRSHASFLTAEPRARQIKRRGPVARRVAGNNLRLAQPVLGWVRARLVSSDPAAQWNVECAGDAFQL